MTQIVAEEQCFTVSCQLFRCHIANCLYGPDHVGSDTHGLWTASINELTCGWMMNAQSTRAAVSPGVEGGNEPTVIGTPEPEHHHQDGGAERQSSLAPARRWGIGSVAPLILVAWLLADIGLRFLPPDWLKLRPVLVAIRFPRPYAPFEPNLRLYTDAFVGEAALEGNLPTQERRPPIRFSTDSIGFRLNPYAPAGAAPEVLVWRGASFTYGAALSDEETFPAQLTQLTGLKAYNGGRFFFDRDGLPELDWLLARLPSKPSTVVCLYNEHTRLGELRQRDTRTIFGVTVPDPRQSMNWRYADRILEAWQRLSPFEVLSTRAFKTVSNGTFLPNPYARNLHPMHLPDGSAMLMRNYEVEAATRVRDRSYVVRMADEMAWVRDQLHARGMDTLFVLIPTRQTVYSPWLKESAGQEAPAYQYQLDLERELNSRSVAVVNGLTILREGIEADLAQRKLVFYRDDNHWNPEGVRRSAAAVATALSSWSANHTSVRVPKTVIVSE